MEKKYLVKRTRNDSMFNAESISKLQAIFSIRLSNIVGDLTKRAILLILYAKGSRGGFPTVSETRVLVYKR